MRSTLSAFLGGARSMARDCFGGIAVTLAVTAPILLGAVALAADYATYSMLRAKLQGVADAAATAGARELTVANVKASLVNAVVENYVNAQADMAWGPVSWTAAVTPKSSEVKVVVEQQWEPIFARLFDGQITPVKAEATAKLLASTTKLCVLALDPSALIAIHLDMTAVVHANGCAVYSNSGSPTSILLDLSSRITASAICAVGGVIYPLASSVTPKPVMDCPAVPDPLRSRPAPSFGGCDHDDLTIKDGTHTLSPGVYCGGLTLAGTAKITLGEGTYVIRDGKLTISGNAEVTGEHVGFYLTGTAAVLSFQGNASIRLTGPLTGAMAGLLFYEDRDAPARNHTISAANADKLVGTIYLPKGTLRIDPNASVAAESAYTAIIANKIELDKGPDLVLNADYDATDVPVPEGLQGSATVVLTD